MYLKENLGAAAIQLTPEDLQELNGIFSHDKARAVGELYALPMDGGVVRVVGGACAVPTTPVGSTAAIAALAPLRCRVSRPHQRAA